VLAGQPVDAAYDAAVAAGSDLRGLEIPEKPQPPKLSAHELNALSGAVRTWTQCKDTELEALLKEVNASNQKLLEIIEARDCQNGGGSAQQVPMGGSGCSPVTTLRRTG
jgi:hypothetical protein